MHVPRTGAALTLAGLLALPSPTTAQNAAEVASRWGLIGTWALDCNRPASGDNGYLTYVIRTAGTVTYERDFGAGRRDVNKVERLQVTDGGALELVVNFPDINQTRRYVLRLGADGRMRVVANADTDGGAPSIADGRYTNSGAETAWQTRCR